MTEFTETPPRLAGGLACLAAAVTITIASLGGGPALLCAVLGLPVLLVGALRGHRELVSLGGLLLVGGAILAGAVGAPPIAVLAGVGAGFVAWDVSEHGIGLGEQVGRDARTRRSVLTHAALSTLVAGATTLVGALIYTAAPGGRPLTALLFLLGGALVIALVLSR